MREHLIVELSNGIKYVIIDMLEEHGNKYFLLTQTSKDETKLSDEFEICRYDPVNNNFDKIENEQEYLHIKEIFDRRIENKRIELAIINKVDFDELIKLEVTSVRKYDYKFKYNNKIIHKNIEFYSNTKPKVGDFVYISIETIGDDMLSYGHIKNINEINHKNILVIERQDKRVYLKRYYG